MSGRERAAEMINEIVPSDVEFARELLNSNHTDAEILTHLASRGIQPAAAAALLDDLRHGRKPSVWQPPLSGQFRTRGASRRHPRGQAAPDPVPASRHSYHRQSRRNIGIPWWFVLLVLVFVFALGYALFEASRHIPEGTVGPDKHEIPPPPGK